MNGERTAAIVATPKHGIASTTSSAAHHTSSATVRKRLATTPWHALAPQAAVDTRATQYVAGSSGRPPSAVSADATVGADRRLPGRRRSRRGGFAGEAAEPPAKAVGTPAPFAAAYADVLPESHREAVRDTAITYLDECSSAIAEGEPGQSYTDTMIGAYLPQRYEGDDEVMLVFAREL